MLFLWVRRQLPHNYVVVGEELLELGGWVDEARSATQQDGSA